MPSLLSSLSPLGAVRKARGAVGELLRMMSGLRESGFLLQMQHIDHLHHALLETPRHREPLRLARHEVQAFSQHGEDGILSEILRRIGPGNRTFIEVGVEDGVESNTAYLLFVGWSGAWVDGDAAALERARKRFAEQIATGRLSIAESMITAENAETVLRGARAPREPDVLSLDIDRNTYHLWKALGHLRPRVVIVEYNASIPPSDEWVIPYDGSATWNGSLYFGAGLKSFELLGRELGYALVGCDLSGTNAFFVREDLAAGRFAEPFTAENHYEPPRYYLVRKRWGHPRHWPRPRKAP